MIKCSSMHIAIFLSLTVFGYISGAYAGQVVIPVITKPAAPSAPLISRSPNIAAPQTLGGSHIVSTTPLTVSAPPPALPPVTLPADVREITFPADMTAWGWMDVTKNGASVVTDTSPNPGCPNALPNLTDTASVTQTTQAIQCRLNAMGFNGNSGSLYFPAGTYYINKTLSITAGYWKQNQDGTYTYFYYGGGAGRSNWTGDIHISGQDPATTKIAWAGSCATDPNIADPTTVTKYNDIFYVNSASTPFVMERLTLDGNQSCAGSGIDFVSKPWGMTPIDIHEMNIQNLKEVGIVGDRRDLTFDELSSGMDMYGNPYSEADNSGMISEVTVSQVNFSNIGYAGVMPNSYNAVDWWIRDSKFDNCNIGISNTTNGVNVWGQPQTPGLAWGGSNGYGGFEVANSIFTNSKTVDINGGNAVRNSYSIASHGPFVEATGNFLAIGNTVVASSGVVPFVIYGGIYGLNLPQLTLMQNQIITQNNQSAVANYVAIDPYSPTTGDFTGASLVIGNIINETYGDVASIGNKFSSTAPFVKATGVQAAGDSNWFNNILGWAPSLSAILQCGPLGGGLSSPIDTRTYCNFPDPNWVPVFNLVTSNDQLGVQITPQLPNLPPVRPIVKRNYILVSLSQANNQTSATSNSVTIQNAINTLAANQSHCVASDYTCADRWGILYLPSGFFPIASTIDVPGSVQLQVVGTGDSNFYWIWSNSTQPPTAISGIFKLHAPSHVMMRDLGLYGQAYIPYSSTQGDGLVVEVTDTTNSRVVTDKLDINGTFSSIGIGNAAFQMKSFGSGNGAGANTIMGNNAQNNGYFSFFTGNPSNLTVGKGANLMIQDTWYEGNDSNYINCTSGDKANITIESSLIFMGGWHSDANTASNLTTFNVGGCATKTAIISDSLGRQICGPAGSFYSGFAGGCLAPAPHMILPAGSTMATQVLFLGSATSNSTYADGNGETSDAVLPANYTGTLNQGYVLVDPNSQAQYADLLGTFFQHFANGNYTDNMQLAAMNTVSTKQSFVNAMVGQALDPRLISSPLLTPPITDMTATDVLIQHVFIQGTKLDLQFVLPGAATQ